jgi:hypothetical protein
MILFQVVLKFRVRILTATGAFLIVGIVEVVNGHDNQIALVLVREGLEQSIIDDAEDGGRRADAKARTKMETNAKRRSFLKPRNAN